MYAKLHNEDFSNMKIDNINVLVAKKNIKEDITSNVVSNFNTNSARKYTKLRINCKNVIIIFFFNFC